MLEQFSYLSEEKIQRHVRSHLVWGVILRHWGSPRPWLIWTLAAPAAAATLVGELWRRTNALDAIMAFTAPLGLLLGAYFMTVLVPRMSRPQFAAFAWLVTKVALGCTAALVVLVAAAVLLAQPTPDTGGKIILLIFGIVWTPWIEFIPAMIPRQKWLTIARLVLTAALIALILTMQ